VDAGRLSVGGMSDETSELRARIEALELEVSRLRAGTADMRSSSEIQRALEEARRARSPDSH